MERNPAAKSGVEMIYDNLEGAASWADVCRGREIGVVFTNGCFDLFHVGHLKTLQFAYAVHGSGRNYVKNFNAVFVGVNSDESVRALKGEGKPIVPQGERMAIVDGLQSVACVFLMDDLDPCVSIDAIRPDVLVKGGDYSVEDIVGKGIVEGYGGGVLVAPLIDTLSTSERIRNIMKHTMEGSL